MNFLGFDSTEGVVNFSMEDNESSNGFYTDSWLCHSERSEESRVRLKNDDGFPGFLAALGMT